MKNLKTFEEHTYFNDSVVTTKCGNTGKISEIFTSIGQSEDGKLIANCKHCGLNGIIMKNHIISYE